MSPSSPGRNAQHGLPHRTSRRRSSRVLAIGIAAASALAATTIDSGATAKTVTPRVAIQVLPTQRVTPGSTAQFPFIIKTTGATGAVSFEATGLPAGGTAEVVNQGNGRYELDVKIATNAPVSSSAIVLRARSKAKLQTTTMYLEVIAGPTAPVTPPAVLPPVTVPPVTAVPTTTATPSAAPVFGLRSDNPEVVATAGQAARFGITVDRSSGYSGAVNFSVTGLPSGVTANFAPNPTTSSSVLYATPSASVPDGRYTLTITGSAGTTSPTLRVVTAVLVVQNQPDFAIDVPASATAAVGAVTNIALGYRTLSATTSPTVTLGVAGLPTGAAAYFSPNPTFGATALVLSLPAGTTVATYPLTITATAGTITHSYALSLVVSGVAGFGITATPSPVSIARGASGNVVVAIVPSGGFTGAVTVTYSGLPATVVATPVNGTNQVTLTITVPSTAAVGSSLITITGTSGSLVASVTLTLTIT